MENFDSEYTNRKRSTKSLKQEIYGRFQEIFIVFTGKFQLENILVASLRNKTKLSSQTKLFPTIKSNPVGILLAN